jgi:hypothetical protein
MTLIETLSSNALFAKKSFAWTGTSTLGAYCVSTTSSHYGAKELWDNCLSILLSYIPPFAIDDMACQSCALRLSFIDKSEKTFGL